jgi:serine/threonine protein kinase
MPNELTCEECGAELPANAPQGLCPRCLAHVGIGLATDAPEATSPLANNPERPIERLRYFGDYELLEEIARGGMGIVYRARQAGLNRIVAVKVLLFGKFSSDEFVQRFKAEAEAAAALQHPNIVTIHEIGEHDGQHYFSMDYIEGKNLADLVRDKPLPANQAATLLKTVAEAIHYAHQRGVLHRDLKPSNVIIDLNGEPHVTDFGLAKRLDGASELTVCGQVLGSPNYMPPEQAERKRGELSPASDVYSLGAILYHLLTGRPPFVAETLEETLLHMLNNDPVSPHLLNSEVPRDLETICFKCLEKDPKRRYDSAEALAMDLTRWLALQPIQARRRTGFQRAVQWWQRHPAIAALIGMSALLTVVLVAFFALTGQNRTTSFVDFSNAYNAPLTDTWFILSNSGNSLTNLPSGLQLLAGTTFNIQGVVQLRGAPAEDNRFPQSVSGIQVSRTCHALHFLHATQRARPDGVRIGHYVVHYGNGSNLSLPLIYSENIRDWWVNDDESVPPPSLVTAWIGSNAESLRDKGPQSIRLFKWTWNNPHPELKIDTIDFISDMTECAPFLVAITADP